MANHVTAESKELNPSSLHNGTNIVDESSRWMDNFKVGDALDRLAATLFVGEDCPASRLIAMFAYSAYFDASGTAEQPFVVVSGYVANFAQWRTFNTAWLMAHEDFGVSLPFHAAEFIAATRTDTYKEQKNARPDYVRLAADGENAHEFFKRLCIAQITHVAFAVSCIVPMKIYEEVNALIKLSEVVPPYAVGARSCIAIVRNWQKFCNIDAPIEMIFENGDFGQGQFTELMTQEGMETPIYKKKADFAGLQGADHYAWEMTFRLKQLDRDVDADCRNALGLLHNCIPKIHAQQTVSTLIEICHRKKIPIRE